MRRFHKAIRGPSGSISRSSDAFWPSEHDNGPLRSPSPAVPVPGTRWGGWGGTEDGGARRLRRPPVSAGCDEVECDVDDHVLLAADQTPLTHLQQDVADVDAVL